jgi:hypothetical protein
MESVRLHEDINKRQISLIKHTLVHFVYLFSYVKILVNTCRYI